MNTAIDFLYIENNTHEGFEMAVARAQKLFLDGWIVTLGLSGKDSGAASICLEVMNTESNALIPNIPFESWWPLPESPFIRPFCAFRNFVFFGCNMIPLYYLRRR